MRSQRLVLLCAFLDPLCVRTAPWSSCARRSSGRNRALSSGVVNVFVFGVKYNWQLQMFSV